MHTYKQTAEGYSVGFYTTDAEGLLDWVKIKSFEQENQAVLLVNFLNGGNQDILIITDLLKNGV